MEETLAEIETRVSHSLKSGSPGNEKDSLTEKNGILNQLRRSLRWVEKIMYVFNRSVGTTDAFCKT